MPNRSEAEEHLRVIRSLMERATIYRAIAAPTALLGGLLSAGLAVWLCGDALAGPVRAGAVTTSWLAVAVATAIANVVFLWQDARRRGDLFVSAGMRMALKALAPSFLVAGALTLRLFSLPDFACIGWSLCYGLALLSTAHFAPRSMARLGWAFLAAGLAFCVITPLQFFAPGAYGLKERVLFSSAFMGLTFGVFHLVYAAWTWPRTSGADDADEAVSPDV